MPTEKLHLKSPFLKDFQANAIGMKILSGKSFAILDKTAFHPQGGGQPGDRGKIADSNVLDTIELDGELLHEVDSPVLLGQVSCSIDWSLRFPLMQLHTGEHLFFSRMKLLNPEINVEKVDFSETGKIFLSGETDLKQILEAESLANSAIRSGIEVKSHIYPTINDAKEGMPASRFKEGRLPKKDIRIVEIAGEDYSACSGTHLENTRDIVLFKVLSVNRQGTYTVVEFAAGENAIEKAVDLGNFALFTSQALQVEPEKIAPTARNQKAELLSLRDSARKLSSIVAKGESPAPETIGEFSLYLKDYVGILDRKDLAELGERLVSLASPKKSLALLFGGLDTDFFTVVIACSPAISQERGAQKLSEKIFPLVGGRGGGKPNFITGSGKVKEEIPRAFLAARDFLSSKS